jgi:Tfp pilus assembly protein PilV
MIAIKRISRRHSRATARLGLTLVEVMVSFAVLTTVLATLTPLLVRHGRLLTEQRQHRLAVDEVCNQLERLAALPVEELRPALNELALSEFAAARLPDASLHGQLEAADMGQRLTLRLTFGDALPSRAPVEMAAWVFPPPEQAASNGEVVP